VVADGDDGTREAARELASKSECSVPIRVAGSSERRGKGLGVREGVSLAVGDIIGFSDADNKTPISEFDNIAPLLRSGYDLVIGSRALRDSRIERVQPWYRRWGSKGFGFFLRACIGMDGIVDTQCGFKFFHGHVARELFGAQQINGYMFDVEILFMARQRGYRIAQVPVRWRDDADSRLQLIAGNIRNVLDVLAIRRIHRAAGRATDDPRSDPSVRV
jgi:dolichyl-phosphate beta-glucosyltransferase